MYRRAAHLALSGAEEADFRLGRSRAEGLAAAASAEGPVQLQANRLDLAAGDESALGRLVRGRRKEAICRAYLNRKCPLR